MNSRPLLLCLACVSLFVAAGCRGVTGGSCHKPQAYAAAQNLPPLRAPSGLDVPDTSEAMKIPELSEPEVPLDRDGPCLEAPPAIAAPPLPPSQVVVPDPQRRPRRSEERETESRPEQQSEPRDEPSRRRRPPSRPR
jgi:hypothetical protein